MVAPYWGGIRMRERQCVFNESMAFEKGNAVFPYYIPSGDACNCSPRYYYPRKEIRNKYTTEIRNILNGCCDKSNDFEADFIADFNQIKGRCRPRSLHLNFKWMNTRVAKKIIKTWKGEPLEVLFYLNDKRIIEKAVTIEQKKLVRK